MRKSSWLMKTPPHRSFICTPLAPPTPLNDSLSLSPTIPALFTARFFFDMPHKFNFPLLFLKYDHGFFFKMTPRKQRRDIYKRTPRAWVLLWYWSCLHYRWKNAFTRPFSSPRKLLTNELRWAINREYIITYRTFNRVLTQFYWQHLLPPTPPPLSACRSGTS